MMGGVISGLLAERCVESACRTKASTRKTSAEPRLLEYLRLPPGSDVRRRRAVRKARAALTRSVAILLSAAGGVNPALSDSAVGHVAPPIGAYLTRGSAARSLYWQTLSRRSEDLPRARLALRHLVLAVAKLGFTTYSLRARGRRGSRRSFQTGHCCFHR